MALITAFGFDDCSSANDFAALGLSSNFIFSAGAGKYGGAALGAVPSNSTTPSFIPIWNDVSGNRGIAMHLQIPLGNSATNNARFSRIGYTNNPANSGVFLEVSTTQIIIWSGSTSPTALVTLNTPIFADGNYHWLEYTIQGADLVVYVDDLEVIRTPASGITMPAGVVHFYMVLTISQAIRPTIDDFISWNAGGSNFNTFPIHPQRISLIRPNAAGLYAQWTPTGTANNWAAVYKTTYSGTLTQYVTAPTAGLKDLYEYTDLAYIPWKINAVMSKVFAQDNGSVTSNLNLTARVGTTEGVLGTVALPVGSNRVLSAISYNDPLGNPWTGSNVNAAQFGLTS